MSIRHAANRFLKTKVDGWDGMRWHAGVTKGAMLAGDRFISDREFGNKLRNLLTDPKKPLPSEMKLVRVGADEHVFLVGRSGHDVIDKPYSTVVTLRRAYYVCEVIAFSSQKAASGMKTNTVKAVVGRYHCDREHITFAASKEFPTVKYGDEVVILPAETAVDTSNELLIGNKYYEVEEVFDFSGLRYCRCVVKSTPSVDIPWAGTASEVSRVEGDLSNDLYRFPWEGNAIADSTLLGDMLVAIPLEASILSDSTVVGTASIPVLVDGSAQSDSVAQGDLRVPLEGSAYADSTSSAELIILESLHGYVVADSVADAGMTSSISLSASAVTGSATLGGILTEVAVSGSSQATSITIGDLTVPIYNPPGSINSQPLGLQPTGLPFGIG